MTSSHDNEPNTKARKLQRQHIYQTYLLLTSKLPPELITPIIHHANLYGSHTTTSENFCAIRITNSPRLLLQSQSIACRAQTRVPVREVFISITSKDQGYVAYPGYGSWTWFSMGIPKGDCGEIQYEREVARNLSSSDGFMTHEITYSAETGDSAEREFVRSLQYGDSVVVRGHAGYRGWTNMVKEVSVTISEAVIAR